KPALLVLGDDERADHRRLLVLGRVLGDLAIDLFQRFSRQHKTPKSETDHVFQKMVTVTIFMSLFAHLSISPKTMSCVPMMATASAIMWPRAISSSAARWGKPGARSLRR